MKVYVIVQSQDYEGDSFVGIRETPEDAMKLADQGYKCRAKWKEHGAGEEKGWSKRLSKSSELTIQIYDTKEGGNES